MWTARASGTSSCPRALLRPWRVLSSYVGPRPPDIISHLGLLSIHSLTACDVSTIQSPTVVILFTTPPALVILLEIHCAFVLVIVPESNSFPTDSNSTLGSPESNCETGSCGVFMNTCHFER